MSRDQDAVLTPLKLIFLDAPAILILAVLEAAPAWKNMDKHTTPVANYKTSSELTLILHLCLSVMLCVPAVMPVQTV